MFKTVAKLLRVFSPQRRRMFWILIGLYMVVGLMQALGVASIGPFVSVLINPESIEGGSGWLTRIYDATGLNNTQYFIAVLSILSAGLIIVGQVTFLLVERRRLNWMHATLAELQRDVMQNILLRPYAFFATRHSGSLSNVVLGETHTAAIRFVFPMIELFSRLTVIAFLLILMLFVDGFVALIMAGLLTVVVMTIYIMTTEKLRKAGESMREMSEQRFTCALEILGGHKEIKLRGSEKKAIISFQTTVFNYAKLAARTEFVRVIPRPLIEAILFAGVIIVTAILAVTSTDALTAFMPKAAVFLFAGYRILPGAQLALQTLQGMRTGEAVVQSVLKEIATPIENIYPLADVTPDTIRAVADFNTFTLSDVSYTYPNASNSALEGVDLSFRRNACIGIVGPSGSGKSTLMDIMLGLLAPSSGTLRIDDTLIEGATLAAWRGNIGYVSQSIFIADDTVTANVAFGEDMPDMDRVRSAVRLAALEPFIDTQPEGLQTRVGEGGARMSGGQRQRLAIARALYHDPKILFLDEATSALDADTESEIMNEIKELVGSRTVIIVAHRLSTLTICDTIIELNNGYVTRNVSGGEFFK